MPSNITGLVDGSNGVDLTADALVTKSYVLDYYPDLLPARIRPGLWALGDNSYGQLGLNNITNYSSPVQVGSLTNWKYVDSSPGLTTGFIKNDGTLWTCGNNLMGALGLGDITKRSSPTQVGSLTNWKQVSVYGTHSSAVKTDGTLWSWGYNNAGQLGDSTTVHKSSPVQIGSLTNWKKVTACGYSCAAIKTDGTIWTWAGNTQGALGLGDTIQRNAPTQVGLLTDWKDIFSCTGNTMLALKTNNSLWSWGANDYGQLGVGDIVHRSSPVQIGSLTDWKFIAFGGSATALAIKSNGSLWGWGYNPSGELGLSDRVHRSSPVQIGALTDWKMVTTNRNFTSAIKTDGTLWRWGDNTYGQLGLNNLISYSSPVQVGSLTNWKFVSGNMAIKEEGNW